MTNVISINKTGKMHINDSKGCDDAVYISALGDIICVADGVSNSEFGGIGAKTLVKGLGQYFSVEANKKMLETDNSNDVRLNVCCIIDRILARLCKKNNLQNPEAFSSTFLAMIKTSDNNITVLHAGDGCIVGQPTTSQESSISIISCPDNSPSGKVYSAGHAEQKNRMRVLHLNPNDYTAILLCTDGFSDPYLDPSSQAFDMQEFSRVFHITSDIELEQLVSAFHIGSFNITDDISCVIYRNKSISPCMEADETIGKYDKDKIESPRTEDSEKNRRKAVPVTNEPNDKVIEAKNRNIPIEKHKVEKKRKLSHAKAAQLFLMIFFLILTSFTLIFLCSEIKELRETVQHNQSKIEILSTEYSILKEHLYSTNSEGNDEANSNKNITEKNTTSSYTNEDATEESSGISTSE